MSPPASKKAKYSTKAQSEKNKLAAKNREVNIFKNYMYPAFLQQQSIFKLQTKARDTNLEERAQNILLEKHELLNGDKTQGKIR